MGELNLPYPQIFCPQTSHKCLCSLPLHVHGSNNTHPLMNFQ